MEKKFLHVIPRRFLFWKKQKLYTSWFFGRLNWSNTGATQNVAFPIESTKNSWIVTCFLVSRKARWTTQFILLLFKWVLAYDQYNFLSCTSQFGILSVWDARSCAINLSYQIESPVFFHQVSVLDLKRYLHIAGFIHGIILAFSSMLTNVRTTACTVGLMIIFSSIPVHMNRNVTMALNKVNCSPWVKVPFLLSAQSFDFSTVFKMSSLTVSFIIGFSAREDFPGCWIWI